MVLALECHLLGVGLGTGLTSLLLGDTGYKETQMIPELGLREERLTIQGMWMKIVVHFKEELLPGCDSYQNMDCHQGTTVLLFVQSLKNQKPPAVDAPIGILAKLDGPHTSECRLLPESVCPQL